MIFYYITVGYEIRLSVNNMGTLQSHCSIHRPVRRDQTQAVAGVEQGPDA
jgi:hypothetical protein